MISRDLEASFKIWRQDALALPHNPPLDPEIPVIALIGAYTAATKDYRRRTVYDWRQSVIASPATANVFWSMLPTLLQDEFDPDYRESIDDIRQANSAGLRLSSQQRHEYTAALDGLPRAALSIPGDEYFLSKVAGHAMHNFALALNPLRVRQRDGEQPIRDFFPHVLQFMMDNAA